MRMAFARQRTFIAMAEQRLNVRNPVAALAKQKRRFGTITASTALTADATQSALCAYMAWVALAGLLANSIWGISWADPVAALALTPLILREGWIAVRTSRMGCDCCTI